PSASKTFPRPASTSEAKSVESPSTTNKNRFSIAALTAVEDASTVTSKPSSPPPKAPSAQNGCGVGHAPTLWLERLSSGGAICDEEEVRQLAHLLFTDPVFAEQVSRLPCVALLFPQIMAFYQQHQDHQRLAALAAAQAAMLASTSQSFANTHASQHNSIGSATMSSYLLPADASSTKMLPPPPPPPPPLQLSHPTFMTPAPSLAAITPSSSSTTAPSGHPVAPPPPLTPSPALFHSSAMAAAIAAGMQAPANPAGFPSHPSAMHQQLMSAHFLSAPPPSVSGAAPQPPPPHPFLVAPPHQPTFWGQHPRLHPAPPGFPYLTVSAPDIAALPCVDYSIVPPPPSANLSAPTARKPPVVDAVDLTSPSSCLAASSSSSTTPQTGRSGKRHVATQPHALFGFPNFWAHQRSPVAVVPPVQQQHHQQAHIHRRAHSLVAPLPRFCDLFRIEGVPSCSGATAHLRICFHILMDKAHGLKPVNPSDPWWYASAGRNLPRPKPRDRPGLHPMPPHLSRFSNYEHILQTAFPIGVGGGGGGGTSAVQASPHHPIAIDLTRSPSPHVGLQLPQARKPLQHDFLRPTDGATKYFLHHHHHHHQQQQQHQQQEAEAILALKRRRVVTDASAASQLPASGHHQNGGIRLPMGLPFPQLPFRHPM
ncbi:unnamed protein product, partial [Mesocestoides corti]|uniref:ARID domain-containing protein n=1 Tax=Mesocestoides corti TaxID=53468 RepID=A0A0R3U6J1_MESCO